MKSTPLGMSDFEDNSTSQRMSKWFERFSEQCKGSPIYEFLSLKVSQDIELLNLASQSQPSQPAPNLFLAAVHFLLLNNPYETLAKFYPSLGGRFDNPEQAYAEFKKFSQKYKVEILNLIQSKLVQTNEVQRCALLLPAISFISGELNNPSLALIDVGASGGLNFLLDQVKVIYSDGTQVGPDNSTLQLQCLSKGNPLPVFNSVRINRRIGIDLNTVNLKDPNEKMWNLSLLWPDQLDRIQRFNQAIKDLEKIKIEFHCGNGNSLLGPIIESIHAHETICVMHSFTLNQFTKEDRELFDKQLKKQSESRDIWRISLEWIGTSNPELIVSQYKTGNVVMNKKLADCHGHGEWIQWQSE